MTVYPAFPRKVQTYKFSHDSNKALFVFQGVTV